MIGRSHSAGIIYRLMKRYPEAIADFKQAIKLNPDDELTAECGPRSIN